MKTLYEASVFDKLEYVSANTLMNEYISRNETTSYDHLPPIVKYGVSDTVQVEMIIKVPKKQEIVYLSSFWQVLKFAWV